MIVDYIDAHRHRFGIDPMCVVLTERDLAVAGHDVVDADTG
ncbi:hypothetical protein GCM10027535_54310 [Mycolicibacterium hippocampi]